MKEHIIQNMLRKIEIILGNGLGGILKAIFLFIIILVASFIIVPILIPFLIGFLSIYAIYTTNNNILRIALILFIVFPYVLMFLRRLSRKKKLKKFMDPIERSR